MTELFLFASTFSVVFFLGIQSLHVNRGHRLAAFVTSFLIGLSNLVILKIVPAANTTEIIAYLCAGPPAIVCSMIVHEKFFKRRALHTQE